MKDMKTLYIPKGETRTYASLDMDRIVVRGSLNVVNGLKAKYVTGGGMIAAGTVSADIIRAGEVETARITCKQLMAKRVSAAEVYAADKTVVSRELKAAYVETGRLITARSEINEVKAKEVIHLRPRKRGILRTLLAASVLSFWLSITAPREKRAKKRTAGKEKQTRTKARENAEDAAVREQVGKTVREIMTENGFPGGDGDAELMRIVNTFLLLRNQGYTLRVLPGTPEENAPVFDFAKEKQSRTAA